MQKTLRDKLIRKLDISKYIVLVLMLINMICVVISDKSFFLMLTTGLLLGFKIGIFWIRCELGWTKV